MRLTSRTRARRTALARRLRDDRGLTLIELLVSIVILGVITVPLGDALITFFGSTGRTTNELGVSHDAQIAASYFAHDVQSLGRRDWTAPPYLLAQSVEVNVAAAGGLAPCGVAGTPDAVVRLLWDDPSVAQTPTLVRVAYVVRTVGTEKQLHRIRCVGGATPVSDLVLAHNVVSVDPVVCSTSCTAAPALPQTVTLTVHLRAPGSTDPVLDIVLTGQRRQT